MKNLVLACALGLGLSGPAAAQSDEIRGVIDRQMEAFLADDFAAAFDFASPAIRNLFRTPENFGRMVREGYPMVWRPAEVTWLGLEERAGELVQRVLVTDRSGKLFTVEYYMIETESGWQINAVQVLPAPSLGA